MRVGLSWNWIRKISWISPLFFEPANESKAYLGLAPGASRFSVVVSTGNWFYCSFDLDWLWKRNSVFPRFGLVCKMWLNGFPFSSFWSSYVPFASIACLLLMVLVILEYISSWVVFQRFDSKKKSAWPRSWIPNCKLERPNFCRFIGDCEMGEWMCVVLCSSFRYSDLFRVFQY